MSKLPPHSVEAEQAVIGCCINTPQESLPEAQSVISEDWFYDIRTKTLWQLLASLELAEINTVTLTSRLKGQPAFETMLPFMLACCDTAISSANLPVWIEELRDKLILRRVVAVGAAMTVEGGNGVTNAMTFLDGVERDILAIRPHQRNETDLKALVRGALTTLEERFEHPDRIFGLSTGLMDLDRLTDGLHPGEMIVVAGFPSTGKTALSMNIAADLALKEIPVAIFTAEMTPAQLVMRSLCAESRVNSRQILERDIPRLIGPAGRIAKAPFYIERASGMTITQVVAIARRLKQKHGIRLVVVDYIGLIAGVGDNREQQISSVSKGIKAMALELNIATIALSQITDDGKLRESRAIGQDADSVWKLANDGDWQPKIQPITLNVEKSRDGETGQIKLTFLKTFTRFEGAARVEESDIPKHYAD